MSEYSLFLSLLMEVGALTVLYLAADLCFLTGEIGNVVGFVVLGSLLQLLTSATAEGKHSDKMQDNMKSLPLLQYTFF